VAGGRRQTAGGRRQEAGGRRQVAGGRRQEAGGRRQEGAFPIFHFSVVILFASVEKLSPQQHLTS
jgi:hypothetical protein